MVDDLAACEHMSQLEIAVTTHHDLETATPARAVKWLTQFQDADVPIAQNDAREGRVSVSLYDQTAELFDSGRNDYLYRLFVRYQGVPLIWAPIKTEWADRCTLIAKDVDRLEAHYLRDGDDATDVPISADYIGLRLLRDAATNTVEQDDRFVVPLGIEDGSNAASTSTGEMTFARGTQVWSAMQQLAGASGAPDFELEPYDISDAGGDGFGWYMKLNTYAEQGTDRTTGPDAVVFHDGYGLNNATGMRAVPDRFITHAHALNYGGGARATAYHEDASRQRGVYVHWEATQFEEGSLALPFVAESYIQAYGLPPHAWSLRLRPDVLQQRVPLLDYGIGDQIIAGVKRGYFSREEEFEIRGIRITQDNQNRQAGAELTLGSVLVDPLDIGTTEE